MIKNYKGAILSGFAYPRALKFDLDGRFMAVRQILRRNRHTRHADQFVAAIQQRQTIALPGRNMVFLQQVPRTASGKVIKRDLVASVANGSLRPLRVRFTAEQRAAS